MKDGINWAGPHGDEFRLAILGYKFPDASDGYEANWLTLRVDAKNRFGSWSREASCWLTWELLWVKTYLTEVVQENTLSVAYSGLECDLGFVFIADTLDSYEFAVTLKSGLGKSEQYDRTSVIYLSVPPDQHKRAIDYLKACAARFPPRGVRGQKGLQLPGPALRNT